MIPMKTEECFIEDFLLFRIKIVKNKGNTKKRIESVLLDNNSVNFKRNILENSRNLTTGIYKQKLY